MDAPRHAIVIAGTYSEQAFSLSRAAELTGMHPEMILEFARADVVSVLGRDPEGSPCFDEYEIARLRHIEHLRQQERLSLRTICYIVRLIDRLDAAERELRALRERMR